MTRFICIITIFLCFCTNNPKDLKIVEFDNNQFIIKLIASNYSMSYSLKYEISNLNYTITMLNGLKGKRDSIVYNKVLSNDQTMKKLIEIDLFDLKYKYDNELVEDGNRLTIVIIKNKKAKTIIVNNTFQKDINQLVLLFNTITPSKYQIKY